MVIACRFCFVLSIHLYSINIFIKWPKSFFQNLNIYIDVCDWHLIHCFAISFVTLTKQCTTYTTYDFMFAFFKLHCFHFISSVSQIENDAVTIHVISECKSYYHSCNTSRPMESARRETINYRATFVVFLSHSHFHFERGAPQCDI